MATLTVDISPTDRIGVRVSGDVSGAVAGRAYRIGSEVVVLTDFQRYPRPWSPRDRTRWNLARGEDDTTAASHTATTPIYGVAEAVTTGTDPGLPTPFPAPGGGSGLPSQWTDGGSGDVTATTDDNTKTALSVQAQPGQDTPTPVFRVLDELGNPIVVVTQEPDAIATTMDLFSGTLLGWLVHLDSNPGLYNEAFVRATVNSVGRFLLDAFSDVVDPTASYTTLSIRAFADQVPPLLELKDGADTTVFAVGGNGQLGAFDKAATPVIQQTLARPSGDAGDLWDILEAYGLVAAP